MTKRSLASLILKLLGVYILSQIGMWWSSTLHLCMWWSSTVHLFRGELSWSWAYNILLMLLLPLTVLWLGPAVLLLRYSDKMAMKLVPEDETVGILKAWAEDKVITVVVMCLGISIMAYVIPNIGGLVSNVIQTHALRAKEPSLPDWMIVQRSSEIKLGITLGLKLLLGLCFMIWPRKIATLIGRLNRLGDNASETSNASCPSSPGETKLVEPPQ